MKMFPGQSAPFAARVYFFTTQEVREILRTHLVNFYRATGRDKEESPEDDDDEKDDRIENFNEYKTVLDTFMAIFVNQDGFETEEKAKNWLRERGSDDDEDTLDTLMRYAEEVMGDHLKEEPFVSIDASTPEHLLYGLQPYAYTLGGEDGEGEVSPWPLVSRVDFGLDHPLLNEGITLIDSPGLSDANSTRAKNAMEHHRQCTHKIIVAEISRAKDDKALREGLALGFRARGSGHNLLVLTRGDSIDSETDVPGSPLEKRNEQRLKDQVKDLRSEKSKLSAKRQKLAREDKLDIEEEIKVVNSKILKKIDELDALRISMRNRSVVSALQKQYRELTGDVKALPAFAVGNEAYKKHGAGYDYYDKPVLSVKETGIPDLRRCLFLLPCEGKLNDALHLATTKLPSLLNSFELYCSRTHMARKGEIEAIIAKPKDSIKDLVQHCIGKLNSDVKQHLLKPMDSEETGFLYEARIRCRSWGINHRKIHLKLLQKYGFKNGTKKSAEIDLTKELILLCQQSMEEHLKNLQTTIAEPFQDLGNSVAKLIDAIRSGIKSMEYVLIWFISPTKLILMQMIVMPI